MYQLHVIGLFIDMRPVVVAYVVVHSWHNSNLLTWNEPEGWGALCLICRSSICNIPSDAWALYRLTSWSYSYAWGSI